VQWLVIGEKGWRPVIAQPNAMRWVKDTPSVLRPEGCSILELSMLYRKGAMWYDMSGTQRNALGWVMAGL
jgi:hypothetical protein